MAIPENAIATNIIEIRNISIGQSYKKIVILVVLNLINNNIKFSKKWLIILIINYSCTNNLKVSESEILSASSWSKNDQLPTFEECVDLNGDEGLLCFRNIIETEMNEFISDKIFPLDTTQYRLTIKIDSEGNFILDELYPYNRLDDAYLKILKDAVSGIKKALPAIKTNVEEFVEVKFNLPFRFNYE
ncbi:MAG: hypothetical protein O3C31_00830 [Bacteroidetes bacterium]|nr:hypothetical protein [Bacteroidota bacterium]